VDLGSSDGTLSEKKAAGVIVGTTVGTTAIATALLALFSIRRARKRRRHRNFLGLIKPPGPGPDTTLVVTDIQESTFLW
jgi:hypothetical protein